MLVGNHPAAVLPGIENALGHLDGEVAIHFMHAGQARTRARLRPGYVVGLGRQQQRRVANVLHQAATTASPSTAGRR